MNLNDFIYYILIIIIKYIHNRYFGKNHIEIIPSAIQNLSNLEAL